MYQTTPTIRLSAAMAMVNDINEFNLGKLTYLNHEKLPLDATDAFIQGYAYAKCENDHKNEYLQEI